MITIHPTELVFWVFVILIINLEIIFDMIEFYYMEQRSKRLMRTYLESSILTLLMTILIFIYINLNGYINYVLSIFLNK